jgi:hypothetical protein
VCDPTGLRIRGHDHHQYSIAGSGNPYWLPHIQRRSLSVNQDVRIQINPVYKFFCLAIFYLPEIRSSASPYLVQSHSQQVLFTRSAIQYHPVIKLINHVFANGVWYWLLSGPGVYLSITGGTNPNLDTCNPTSTFRLPERHLYDHPFIVWRLMTSKLSFGTREWHYLMV